MSSKFLSASILAADFAHLANDVNAVLDAGVEYIHFDVMDHHFVPNLSFGSVICSALRKVNILAPIDVHLMVTDPEKYIEPFAEAGANLISFHPETVDDVERVVRKINDFGMGAGLVFNPDKEIIMDVDLAQQLKMILIMSVFPGFGGQKFMPEVLSKVRKLRAWLDQYKLDILLAIDGGIKIDTIRDAAAAGANYFVVGSGLFGAENYELRVKELKAAW